MGQPWFGANFIEASVLPVVGGGLEGPQQLKITFREGQSWEFFSVMEDIKSRSGGLPSIHARPVEVEDLPMYTPSPVEATSSNPLTRQPQHPTRQPSEPDMDSIEAANVALQAERDEEDERGRELDAGDARTVPEGRDEGGPPGYDEVRRS